MSNTNTVFESAEFYETETKFDKKLIEYRYLTVKKYLKGSSCLELGPGSGVMTGLLQHDFEKMLVVDGSQSVLNNIPQSDKVETSLCLFEELKLDITFDTIVIEHVLEHLEDPIKLLTTVKQWMHKETILCLGVPNANSIHRLVAVEMGSLQSIKTLNARDLRFGHQRVYDEKEFHDHIKLAGLSIIEAGGVFLKPLSNGQINEGWTEDMWDGFYEAGKKFSKNCAELYAICKL